MNATETALTINPYMNAQDIWRQLPGLDDVSDHEIALGIADLLRSRIAGKNSLAVPIGPTDAALAFTLGAFSHDGEPRLDSERDNSLLVRELEAWKTLGESFSRETVKQQYPHPLSEKQWNIGSFGLWKFAHTIQKNERTVNALALLLTHTETLRDDGISVLGSADQEYVFNSNRTILEYMITSARPISGTMDEDMMIFQTFRDQYSEYILANTSDSGNTLRVVLTDWLLQRYLITDTRIEQILESFAVRIFDAKVDYNRIEVHRDQDISMLTHALDAYVSMLSHYIGSRWDPEAVNLKYISLTEALLAAAVSVYNIGRSNGANFPDMRFVGFSRTTDFIQYAISSGEIDSLYQFVVDGVLTPDEIVSTDVWARGVKLPLEKQSDHAKQLIKYIRSGVDMGMIAKHM